ncbi:MULTISPECIES: hypothetical protein [Caproicibacterium]|jgi:hypothetical protein|uniref:Uncharacterized protein n=1 Tax=Caproicibacterium lactatifermentans TaxID=2666138 RepID=A0A859DNL3_9FIRM|nr:hypothetical protein [Caproicibacterium lactatifermentans]ARP50681.1 hypothetical protein B6259_07220 [Ruminococcaceae bacterium CPB6]MDD4808116.1 hypothetical protein [Oscillospiraceae bacterium]QKN23587.1 hypothetical protein GJQ69_03255 [Caproicibacterium lactatifermentans]QKO29737.1 hypothetical protein GKP14_01110 [Caproicibacterium lactatifermentans]
MFCPYCASDFHDRQQSLHKAAKTGGALALVFGLLTLCGGIAYVVNKAKCIHELNHSLPVIRLAAKKYLQKNTGPVPEESTANEEDMD